MNHFKKTLLWLLIQFVILPLSAKSLDWEKIEVKAYLTKEGILEVEEIQAIRFDGDWNGGYRDYNVSYGQTLTFQGIERKSESGAMEAAGNVVKMSFPSSFAYAVGNLYF